MAMKPGLRATLLGASMMLAVVSGGARAQEIPVVTGDHWTQSTEQMKKAYLLGIANTVQIETAYAGSNPPSDAQSLVPRVVRGMKGETLDSVRQGLDKWYAANPAKLNRPVIETIWFEMVVPGLQKNK